jgi:hypothetical protein
MLRLHACAAAQCLHSSRSIQAAVSLATCPCCRAGGARFPWWAGVILGVGLALIVAAVLLTLAACYVRRLQRRNSELASSVRDVESKVSGTAIWCLRPGPAAVCCGFLGVTVGRTHTPLNSRASEHMGADCT